MVMKRVRNISLLEPRSAETAKEERKSGKVVNLPIRGNSAGPATRLILVHGSWILAEALRTSIEESPDFVLGEMFDNAAAAAEFCKENPLEVILVDAGAGSHGPLDSVRFLDRHVDQEHIVVMGLDRVEDILEYLAAGARGYVGREASFEELLEVIRAVCRGEAPCSPEVAASVFRRIAELSGQLEKQPRRKLPETAQLTRREREVLLLVAAGDQNKEIACQLQISTLTVKNHVHRILEKLQVGNRRQAIQLAYETGLLENSMPWIKSP